MTEATEVTKRSIYRIDIDKHEPMLVRARNKARALAFAHARIRSICRVATQDELLELSLKRSIPVLDADEKPAEPASE